MRLAVLALALAGCLDAIAPEVGPLTTPDDQLCNADSDAAVPVSFAARIAPLFEDQCTRCHRDDGEGFRESGLDLTSYDGLRAGGTRSIDTIVVPGEPCASVVFQKVGEAPPFGTRMPRDDAPLSADEQQLLHDWISEGALAN